MKFLQSRLHIPSFAVPNIEPESMEIIHEQLANV